MRQNLHAKLLRPGKIEDFPSSPHLRLGRPSIASQIQTIRISVDPSALVNLPRPNGLLAHLAGYDNNNNNNNNN